MNYKYEEAAFSAGYCTHTRALSKNSKFLAVVFAKDVGTAIRKSIVVLFLPCLVTFFEIPSLHASLFCKCFFVT